MYLTVDHGLWNLVGPRRLSFIWLARHARVLSCTANVEALESVHIEEYRAVELCPTFTYP
jgi:hypothetical protein